MFKRSTTWPNTGLRPHWKKRTPAYFQNGTHIATNWTTTHGICRSIETRPCWGWHCPVLSARAAVAAAHNAGWFEPARRQHQAATVVRLLQAKTLYQPAADESTTTGCTPVCCMALALTPIHQPELAGYAHCGTEQMLGSTQLGTHLPHKVQKVQQLGPATPQGVAGFQGRFHPHLCIVVALLVLVC